MGLFVKGIHASGPYGFEPIIYSILFYSVLLFFCSPYGEQMEKKNALLPANLRSINPNQE
jgi:hypothetical protein